jgi:hypothetical protein
LSVIFYITGNKYCDNLPSKSRNNRDRVKETIT